MTTKLKVWEKKNYDRNFIQKNILEFKDAFELFDRTGDGIIGYDQCVDVARCFGYNPTEYGLKGKLIITPEKRL